jgi:hypothetical protein
MIWTLKGQNAIFLDKRGSAETSRLESKVVTGTQSTLSNSLWPRYSLGLWQHVLQHGHLQILLSGGFLKDLPYPTI